MIGYSPMFSAVVVRIFTFRCEIWTMSDTHSENEMALQRYAGRRVQRFPKRSPNSISFLCLGLVRLAAYVCVKKQLFILTILKMGVTNVIRQIVEARTETYENENGSHVTNSFSSPYYDILNTCSKFGLLSTVMSMIGEMKPQMAQTPSTNLV